MWLQKIISTLMVAALSISAAHAAISYTDVGSGTPIILIHPFPTDQNLWQPQRDGLKSHFRVITLDLLGFGRAAPVDGKAITMTEYADEVKQLLDQLHIDKAIVGGESMGGYITLAFLQKYPERVSGLILSDTQSIADTDEAKAKREVTALDILANGTANLVTDVLSKALSPNASIEAHQQLKSILEVQSRFGVVSALRGIALRNDLTQVLTDANLPTLIITGTADVIISPQQSEAMHRAARNSKLVKIEGAGHMSNLENPEEWNNAVKEYFSSL